MPALDASLLYAYFSVLLFLLAGLLQSRASLARLLTSPLLAALLTAIAAPAVAYAQAALARSGSTYAHAAQLSLLLLFPALGYIVGIASGRRRPAVDHKRGTVILDAPARPPKPARGELTLAGLRVGALDETKHFKLIGTTGTGKSTAIRELIGAALARGDRAVIADPDGGYAERFYDPARGDKLLNPFDPRSCAWALFDEIATGYDVDQLVRALIPDGEGGDGREWRAYARTFLTSLVKQLHLANVHELRELHRLVATAPSDELRLLLGGTPAQPFLEPGNERMFGSIRSVTTSALGWLEHVAAHEGEPLSIRGWVRGEGAGALFLPYRADQIAALRSVISAWLRLAIFQTMSSGERDHRLWFCVDELDALGAIDGLKDALARLRKFGGRCVLGFQSIAQVSHTYGPGEAQTIVENCGNTLILRCSASERGGTAQFASRLIGEREVVRTHVTVSRSASLFEKPRKTRSLSLQHVTEPAVLTSEIEQLPDLSGYLKLASEPCWRRVRLTS
jgi:type IV secretory pathway TraG/TraD family ATPase VirD4